MTGKEDTPPSCFGKLDIVFPKGDDDLRHTPEACMACIHKTDCLKSAMKDSNGLGVQEALVDRAYLSGKISFWERWSKKKYIQKKIKRTMSVKGKK